MLQYASDLAVEEDLYVHVPDYHIRKTFIRIVVMWMSWGVLSGLPTNVCRTPVSVTPGGWSWASNPAASAHGRAGNPSTPTAHTESDPAERERAPQMRSRVSLGKSASPDNDGRSKSFSRSLGGTPRLSRQVAIAIDWQVRRPSEARASTGHGVGL